MELVSYWIIISIFIINIPTYGDNYIPTEHRQVLHIEHKSKDSCEKIAIGMFKNMKKEETKDAPQKLSKIYCVEQFKVIKNDRSLQNRTQGNGSRSFPDT